jgi:uncharacterized protein (TIGR03000 family)
MLRRQFHARSFACLSMLIVSFAVAAGGARADSDSSERAKPDPSGQPAEITLNVPLDAIVFVDGQRTNTSGLSRRFVTPPLSSGQKYYYDVKVSWIEGSRPRVYNRHLSFKAGDRIALNLAQPNWTEYQQDLYLDPAAPAPWRTDYYNDERNFPNYPNRPYIFPGTRFTPPPR